MKKQNGITLISLVVTIIILVILIGVTIKVATNIGIIKNAKTATERMKYETAKEKVNTAIIATRVRFSGKLEITGLIEEVELIGTVENNQWPIRAKVDGYLFDITKEGEIISIQEEKKETYKISYNLDGGTNPNEAPTSYQTGTETILLNPEKEGYVFDGWYRESSYITERILKISSSSTGDITLYAKWIQETNPNYLTWTTTTTSATVTGFSELGLEAYNAGTLKNLVIPKKYNGLDTVEIGNWAFDGRSQLAMLVIPNCVEQIGAYAFRDCTNMSKIIAPISLKLSDSPGCTSVTEVIFTKGTGIGVSYWQNSHQSTPWYISKDNQIKITLEEGITQIGDNTFNGCTNLKGPLNLPSSLTSIGIRAFEECNSLEGDINIPSGVTNIGYEAFNGCSSLTGDINIPSGIETIEDYVFNGCSKISNIYISSGVKKIEGRAFKGCSGVEEVVIPDSVTEIEAYALENCTNMSKITAPISLKLSDSPGCTSVTEVIFTKGTGIGVSYWQNSHQSTPWYISKDNQIKITLEEGITQIGDNTFNGCTNLKGPLNLPSSLTSIGIRAFEECNSLEGDINIPSGVTNIGYEAFNGCSSLTGDINIPSGIETIEDYVFSGCSKISNIYISDGVETIGFRAFYGCSSVTKIGIPESVTEIKAYAFEKIENATIYYAGTSEAWDSIKKENTYTNVQYNSTI